MTHLEPGMPAPDFTLLDQDGASVSLADFSGQGLVVYFYPEALTSACKQQACDFRDRLPDLSKHGYAVVGISRDSIEKLARARDLDGITFPLLSDTDLTAHRAWGTWGEKNSYGRIVEGVRRSTFVVGGGWAPHSRLLQHEGKGSPRDARQATLVQQLTNLRRRERRGGDQRARYSATS